MVRIRVDQSFENAAQDRDVHYQYDSLYRLTTERERDATDSANTRLVTYTLDDVGNRMERIVDDGTEFVTETYQYDDRDRLTDITAVGVPSTAAAPEVKKRYHAALVRQPSRYAPWAMLGFAGLTLSLLLSAALAPLGWLGLSSRRRRRVSRRGARVGVRPAPWGKRQRRRRDQSFAQLLGRNNSPSSSE